MRAARLLENRTELSLDEVPDLEPGTGSAVIRVASVFLSPYMASLVDGTEAFETPPRPFTPGMDAIGTVERVADDVSGLAVGDRVYCDSYIEEPRADGGGEYAFAACFAISANSGPLLARWPNGALATQMDLPAECLTRIEPALARASTETLCRLGWLGTAYAAFEKTNFQPGQSVAVLGATGLLGVSTVLVALALGAGRVVAVGRSEERLAAFEGLDPRIETASAPPGADDRVDLAISAMAGDASRPLEDALQGLKRYGTLVVLATTETPPQITGLVTRDLSVRGSLWFSRAIPARLVDLIASGELPLERIQSHTYPLNEVGAALAHSAKVLVPFEQVVICP